MGRQPFAGSLALMALGIVGCWQPATVPPPASIPRMPPPVQIAPQITPLPDGPSAAPSMMPIQPIQPLEPPPQSISANPWRPTVPARNWKAIVLHHTAAEAGSVESIHEAHLKRKDASGNSWLGIGYHFVIGNGNGMGDGEIGPTFRWKQQMHGAHAGEKTHNQTGIGITLVGNFEEKPPTSKQLAAVKRLVSVLKAEYGIPNDKVIGHGDVKATACPGKLFPLDEVRLTPALTYEQQIANPTLIGFAGTEGSRP